MALRKPTPKPPTASGESVPGNPYVEWAWGPGRPYYFPPGLQDGPDKRMTLLVHLQGMSAEQFVNGGFFLKNDRQRLAWQSSFVIPFPGAPTLAAGDKQLSWVICFATPEISNTLTTSPDLRPYVADVILGRPLDSQSLPTPTSPPNPEEGLQAMAARLSRFKPTLKPPAVFMGVIDDGIAFANARFRLLVGGKHRTRVQDWWMMGTPGNTLNAVDINTLFDRYTDGNGVLQEELVYREAGLLDYTRPDHKAVAWRVTHGTHVMDAACGYDPSDNQLERPLACVQLPLAVTAAVDNGNLYPYFVWAVGFIVMSMLDYCYEQNIAPIPVVINFSYGRLEGPHDGSSAIESFIEWATGICQTLGFPLRFVLPSGNSYLSRTHAQMRFSAVGQTRQVAWHVLPDDQSESFVEIWAPLRTGTASRLTLTVTDPLGDSYTIDENQVSVALGSYGQLVHRWTQTRGVFFILLPPTASFVAGPLAPCGTYQVQLKHTGGLAASAYVDAWVARDDTIPGYPQFGRQSYFNDRLYEVYDRYSGRVVQTDNNSLVQRQCTINAIATGKAPIVIGGFLRKEMKAAEYTAAGAAKPRPQPPRWPDAMAPSDDTYVLAGRLAAGSHSGSRVAVAGTSVAAPQIAKWVADDLAIGGKGDGKAVQDKADFDEANPPTDAPPPPWTPKPPEERGGHGRIWSKPLQKVKRYEW
jgi:hypothetical protein